MKSSRHLWVVMACAPIILAQTGCKVTESALSSTKFSQSAYDNDKAVKAQALALIDRGKDHALYTTVATDVDQLQAKIDKTISTEQARTHSAPTVEQWKKVKGQLTKFFERWKTKGSLAPVYVEDMKGQISEIFDNLIKTEEDKRKQS